MGERDDEREASRAYRDLPREEPPSRLDDAIRAAARREAQSRPAPLVAPTGRRRWYFPVAAAAVVVLAVAVTSQVEREQAQPASGASGIALEMAKKEAAPAQEPAQKPNAAPEPRRQAQARAQVQAERRPSREEFSRERMARDEAPKPQAAAPAPAAPQASLGAAAGSLAKTATPESELERIAELRRQGKDEEADRALAEFRKRHPDYRIATEMLEKVEKKK